MAETQKGLFGEVRRQEIASLVKKKSKDKANNKLEN